MYDELRDKVALVTGAGRPGGLGAEIARRLAAEGCAVMLHDIGQSPTADSANTGSTTDLSATAKAITDEVDAQVATCTADLLEEREVEGLVETTVNTFGRIDILVNNAGVGFKFGPLLEMDAADWDLVQGVNLRGTFLAMKHAARKMVAQPAQPGWGRGRIISIGSRAAKSGTAWAGAYAASKHGLIGLTRSLALELASREITVNAVCPNHVTTRLGTWQNAFMANARGQDVETYLADMRARIPIGRVGLPDDTAKACLFLASAQASYITAEAMNVSGGEEYH